MKKVSIILCLFILLTTQAAFGASSVNIAGQHTVENNTTLKTGRHTFTLTAKDNAPMPADALNGVKRITISSNEMFSFGDIYFEKPGIYTYFLTREQISSDDLEEDTAGYTVKVTVAGDGEITTTYEKENESGKADKIIFTDSHISTLTFNLDGGDLNGDLGPIQYKYKTGQTVRLPEAPVKQGYSFDYWKGSKYDAGAEYQVMGDHEFTAVYKKDSHFIGLKTDKNTKSSNKTAEVKTGDSTDIFIFSGMLLASVIALFAVRRKRED